MQFTVTTSTKNKTKIKRARHSTLWTRGVIVQYDGIHVAVAVEADGAVLAAPAAELVLVRAARAADGVGRRERAIVTWAIT